MEQQSDLAQLALGYAQTGLDIAREWIMSPAAWSQFALLIAAFFLAVPVARKIRRSLTRVIAPADGARGLVADARRAALPFLALLLPLLAYAFTAIGEEVTRSMFGSGAVIAFGKRVFLFLAARAFVRDIVRDPFLKFLGRYVLMPIMALYAVGLLDDLMVWLGAQEVALGNIRFTALAIVRGLIAGSLLFWLGRWSTGQSKALIEKQKELRPATRELAIKATEIGIFGALFLILMNIMGIDLTTLAVLGGAVGVGVGLGLQKIASNFISGVILLLEGQTTVGDYVELDGGEAGTIVKMTARATILETFDGRWIVVPNEDFIATRVVNFSDAGKAHRYAVDFSVSYDTDINRVPGIISKAVSAHPEVLDDPEPPDCELSGFGDSGIDFSVEFWVNGIDDGKNKYCSDVRFLVWNALKDAGIEIPYPHRVVELRGAPASEA